MPSAAAARVCTPPALSSASRMSRFSNASTRSVKLPSPSLPASAFSPPRCSGRSDVATTLAAREHDRAVDEVLELAHVARVVVLRAAGPSPRARRRGALPSSAKRRRKWSTRSGMSSRRSRSGGSVIDDDVEPVERSSRNSPARGHRLEVAVGRGDHADVDLDRARAADPLERLLLQHAQQLDLRARAAGRRSRRGTASRRRPARSGRAARASAPVNAPRSCPNSSDSSSVSGSAAS